MQYVPPRKFRIDDSAPATMAYREKYNPKNHQGLCSALISAALGSSPTKPSCRPGTLSLVRKHDAKPLAAETAENTLTRYLAKEMIGLLDTVGRITEFDYSLMLQTLNFVDVRPPDKLSFVFQCGIRITV